MKPNSVAASQQKALYPQIISFQITCFKNAMEQIIPYILSKSDYLTTWHRVATEITGIISAPMGHCTFIES